MTKEVFAGLALAAMSSTLCLGQKPAVAILPVQDNIQALPNMGQQITPLAVQGSRFEPLNPELAAYPGWLASNAVTTAVSADHKTLVVLTSGFNRIYSVENPPAPQPPWNPLISTEYAFIYDISQGTPVNKQIVPIANTYHGVVFDPNNSVFYVSGGPSDNIHIVVRSATGIWADQAGKLGLGHSGGIGLNLKPNGATAINSAVGVTSCAAGIAISNDGMTLAVVNYYNDSITVFSGGYGSWSLQREIDLRPGKDNALQSGVPGGEYPFWVLLKGNGPAATAYVSSIRDREIDVVSLAGATPAVVNRIAVKGQPNKMIMNAAQTLLYVAEDESDSVDVINTVTNTIVETIPVIAPPLLIPAALAQYTGANTNSVTISPDETQLYVTNGTLNSVAVVALGGTHIGDQVVGLIPAGWYPNSASAVSVGGAVYMYVVNGKSPTGPNVGWCYGGYGPPNTPNCNIQNQYNPQLTKAGLQTFVLPGASQLSALTAQVFINNRLNSTESASDAAVMAAVRQGVQHVIFIIKENRTYDQILGDLPIGNGDPDLVEFGQAITPNLHNLAQTFVTLDNFFDTAEVSYDGWLWTTSARAPDVVAHQFPVAYSYRGLSLDSEGLNRNVNVAIPTLGARQAADPFTSNDPDVLPGTVNTAAPDGPNNELNSGYLWDNALRAGLSVRSYGFFIDTTLYSTATNTIPLARDPFSSGTIVANSSNVALAKFTDPYFRGFDNAFPDYWRYTEWARDFDASYANGGLPSLSLVRLMHDHTGNYTAGPGGAPPAAIDGVNLPELQIADNDYAVGLLIQKISTSIYANNTLIFVIEDDAQDGGDHVDSHRTTAYVAGAYVKQGALVSTQYNTLDWVRTIEEVLGLPPMNLNDALARPMTDIFNTSPSPWTFTATPSAILYNTQLPLPPKAAGLMVPKPTHNAKYWARATKGMDFKDEDRVDPLDFNQILWKGLMGKKPYPSAPTGLDLRLNREDLLARYRRSLKQNAASPAKSGAN
jgi:YVTN family beta-propeller protein